MARAKESGLPADVHHAAVIVAHPDDETLWAGGTMLMHPHCRWVVGCLCRASDADRARKFRRALERLGASGQIADLEDSPDQPPLPEELVEKTVLSVLRERSFDLLLTHSPRGEYTRHLRHEETARAVLGLWESGALSLRRVWMFAYADGAGRHLPQAIRLADRAETLPQRIWDEKYRLITEVYGFGSDSFEAHAAPRTEAFWCFDSPAAARHWMQGKATQP